MAIKRRNNNILLTYLSILLLMKPSTSQKNQLLQGQFLNDGDELVSAEGNFRLEFFSPDGTTDRYLGIMHQGSTEPVWVANRNNPVLDKSGYLIIDSKDGNLKILHNGRNPIVISSAIAEGNTTATLQKTGNFVLREVNSDGSTRKEIWESFDYPTDTLLPGMKLGINFQTGHQWFLQSWASDKSPAQGSFTLGMDSNVSNQLIIRWREEVYWTSGPSLNERFNTTSSLDDYQFSYISDEQGKSFLYSSNVEDTSFPMLKIRFEGSLQDVSSGRLVIFCDDITQCVNYMTFPGCTRESSDVEVINKDSFMSGDGFRFKESDNMTVIDCEIKCLNNFSCIAFAATNENNNTGCEIWSRETKFTESSTGDFRKIYIFRECPRKEEYPNESTRAKHKTRVKWWVPLTIALGSALLIALFCYLSCFIWKKLKTKVDRKMNRKKLLRELQDNVSLPTVYGKRRTQAKDQSTNHELKIFDFQTIAAATDNFSIANKLGQGGFGTVYKGRLLDGQEVAIKRLSKSSGQGIMEFKNEAKLIAKLQHTNLVTLLGCSLQGEERILVYEYMPNKSLDRFIFDSRRKDLLNWKKRFNVIEGIAQGLLYLHKYSRLKVIHRDLKAGNILLDDHMNPKISDFGLARTFVKNESEANTNRIAGTYGYMSPEYIMNGIVSMKTDVFSFVVLVLETVSGKKNHGCYHAERPLSLTGYAWQLWDEGKGLDLMDLNLMDESCSPDEVLRCIHVGLLCVQDQATDRPTMSDVVSMLTNETMILAAPKQPAFFINIASDQAVVVSQIKLEICSENEVTISEMDGR